MKRIVTTFVALVFLALPLFAQLTGKITMVGVPDRYRTTNANMATTGLKTLGIGQRAVMAATAIGTGGGINYNDPWVKITSAAWTFTSKPAGSNATFINTTVQLADTGALAAAPVTYFVPDVAGTYVVSMVPTTASGVGAAGTITIIAGKFIGAGIGAPSTLNGIVPNSCICHQGSLAQPFIDLKSTNHAQAVKRKMNETGGHFSGSCMSCHSIGYDYNSKTGNDGWDDLIAGADSTYYKWFPNVRPNGPGTWEGFIAAFPNLAAHAGIQCENCHGPASEHIAIADPAKMDVTQSSTICNACHFSSNRHGIGYQWAASKHAVSINGGSTTSPQGENRFPCARCHSSQGYINEVIGGNPQPTVTSPKVVYDNGMPIGCQTCHDPHTNNNPGLKDATTGAYTYPQLRAKSIGEACIGCHQTRLATHESQQGSMLLGHNATPFSLDKAEAFRKYPTVMANNVGLWSGWELPGYTYQNGSHSDIEERCVTCHMAKTPSYIANEASGFAIGDSLMNRLGMHTFKVAVDLADGTTYLNPTGCKECHGTVTIDFVDLTQAKTADLLNALYLVLPRRDTAVNVSNGYTNGAPIGFNDTTTWMGTAKPATVVKRPTTVAERAAAYNYWFVKNDFSGGVHNFTYAKGLLESSIEQMKLGQGAASIAQIKDVPMDNGNNVQIVWNKFPAESYAYGKLTSYGIWRKDPLLPSLSKYVSTLNSFTQLMKSASVGGQYTMGGYVWTYVASVPAVGMAQYSFIAPTLFDSTKTSGIRYSAFFISGNTSDGTNTMYQSPIDSGYSVNNLFPSMVSGVNGAANANGIQLSWTRSSNPVDNDVTQYLVFRSTTSGFTPNPSAPYAAVSSAGYLDGTVTTGTTYYYRIGAVDKAGNIGPYSDQFTLKVTSVQEMSGVPTEFALDQNYPNPFNPSTQIKFALPSQAQVVLNIYSVSGELVRTLVNNTMAAGFYNVAWNGLNDKGQQVSAGVYLYRVQAGTYVSTRKMLLMK